MCRRFAKGSLRNSFPLSKQAKVILSPSKEAFAVWDPQDPLEIALRQAQGDFSLDKGRKLFLYGPCRRWAEEPRTGPLP